ncbi:MAG: molybdopterin-synthase adenylyltransferase MoeB [Kiritimatiellae bacterium]|jgi:molybdopterin/thiamine biosynthesis adenylyltransferase|nr:molybdopterin-synthase adenylyltransferase MoeB [Kiritimatiellia bacterium]MDD4342592.1 molybdopterin-synthase adenylyltransferase MoeB [Kiritimatiellia bacterium]MDY0148460.1 molybdopterin-synthase adenylyltransferase MoeB [Kiritimatiellia bacterium]
MSLRADQIERYSRHILLQDIGGKGQEKLLAGRVLIIGAGGLGAPIALYLGAAGVGTLGIADADMVDVTNLQRQVIHFTPDIGKPKVVSAAEKVRAINPDVTVHPHQEWISAENIAGFIADYDFIIDGTDNFATKFLINDACVLGNKPYSHGGILRFDGQTLTVKPHESACYRCIFSAPPPKDAIPTCSEAGVIGVLPGVIGTIQATEAIKYLLGIGDLLTGRLLTYNATSLTFREIRIQRNPKCPVCGSQPTLTELKDNSDALNVCELETT